MLKPNSATIRLMRKWNDNPDNWSLKIRYNPSTGVFSAIRRSMPYVKGKPRDVVKTAYRFDHILKWVKRDRQLADHHYQTGLIPRSHFDNRDFFFAYQKDTGRVDFCWWEGNVKRYGTCTINTAAAPIGPDGGCRPGYLKEVCDPEYHLMYDTPEFCERVPA